MCLYCRSLWPTNQCADWQNRKPDRNGCTTAYCQRYDHGYCTDDNCRALVCALRHYELTKEDSVLALADRYLSFTHHAFNSDQQRFRNFLSYDRRWLEDIGSEDVHGRTVWALGSAVMLAPNDAILSLSIRMLQGSPRATP